MPRESSPEGSRIKSSNTVGEPSASGFDAMASQLLDNQKRRRDEQDGSHQQRVSRSSGRMSTAEALAKLSAPSEVNQQIEAGIARFEQQAGEREQAQLAFQLDRLDSKVVSDLKRSMKKSRVGHEVEVLDDYRRRQVSGKNQRYTRKQALEALKAIKNSLDAKKDNTIGKRQLDFKQHLEDLEDEYGGRPKRPRLESRPARMMGPDAGSLGRRQQSSWQVDSYSDEPQGSVEGQFGVSKCGENPVLRNEQDELVPATFKLNAERLITARRSQRQQDEQGQ